MHEESSYDGLDPIECEVRGGEHSGCCSVVRIFISSAHPFGSLTSVSADKSMSILLGRPICLRDEDCTLHFPKEVDDEL